MIEKRKKNRKNKRKTNKKRRGKIQSREDTNSEWETKSEESVSESSIDLPWEVSIPTKCDDHDPACYNLFEDPCTPEKVRDATIAREPLHRESPISQVSRKLRLISQKDHIVDRDELSMVELPSIIVRNVSPADTEDENEPIFGMCVSLRESKILHNR